MARMTDVNSGPASKESQAHSSAKMRDAFSQFMEQLQPLRTFHMSQGYTGSPQYPGVILLFLAPMLSSNH
jgi:hypothetical protein